MAQNKRSLNYLGVNATNPPNIIFSQRTPINPHDWRNVEIGDFWVVKNSHQLWYLASLANNGTQSNPMSTWIRLYPRGDAIEQFIADTGVANEENSVINILGGTNINTSGAADTVTINLNDTISLTGGLNVAGIVTLSGIVDGVVQGDANGDLSASRGNDGQLLIGRTNANPTWGSLTSTDATVVITEGPGTLDFTLSAGGIGGAEQFNTDNGVAHELNQVIQIRGENNIATSGLMNSLTIASGNNTFNAINMTVDGITTFNNVISGILQKNSHGTIIASRGDDGELLISNGNDNGNIPSFSLLTSSNNTINIQNGAGTINLSASGSGGSKYDFLSRSSSNTTTTYPYPELKQSGQSDTSVVYLDKVKTPYTAAPFYNGNQLPAETKVTIKETGYYVIGAYISIFPRDEGPRRTFSTNYGGPTNYRTLIYINGNRFVLCNSVVGATTSYCLARSYIKTGGSYVYGTQRWRVGSSMLIRLNAGDIIYPEVNYSSRLFYNQSDAPKRALVYSYAYGTDGIKTGEEVVYTGESFFCYMIRAI